MLFFLLFFLVIIYLIYLMAELGVWSKMNFHFNCKMKCGLHGRWRLIAISPYVVLLQRKYILRICTATLLASVLNCLDHGYKTGGSTGRSTVIIGRECTSSGAKQHMEKLRLNVTSIKPRLILEFHPTLHCSSELHFENWTSGNHDVSHRKPFNIQSGKKE